VGVRDSRPLGSGMVSSAFFFADARSTATTGAWPSPTIRLWGPEWTRLPQTGTVRSRTLRGSGPGGALSSS
jgi:hypothetical protein